MRVLVSRFLSDESGATAIEYGLIIALVVVVLLSGLTAFADTNNGLFAIAKDAIGTAIAGALN